MTTGREIYLQTLDAVESKTARKAALQRAHDIREFEIELYWKRANYFWLLQAAVFAAVGLTWKAEGAALPEILPIGLASLGVITAWGGWLANQGSKFWQQNWEHHIDMLEAEFEGNIYKTVYVGPLGISWSLTRVSEALSLCFTVFWFFVLILATLTKNPDWTFKSSELAWPHTLIEWETIGSWLFTVAGVRFLFRQSSRISGKHIDYPDEMDRHGDPMGFPRLRRATNARAFLVRREPNI